MKPPCFASVALYNPSKGTCAACSHARDCYEGAMFRIGQMPDLPEVRAERLRLAALAPAMGARMSRRGIARRPLSDDESSRLRGLAARGRSMAGRLAKTGWFEAARHQLASRQNPGKEGSSMQLLLRELLMGPTARSGIVTRLVTELGMKASSAQVEASTLIAVLEFGGLARMRGGVIELTPNFTRDTFATPDAQMASRTLQ